jgi:hypothetical protein
MAERGYYVETSVWGMIPKGQPRAMRRATLQFLRRSLGGTYFVSQVVLDEVSLCPEPLRAQIMEVFEAAAPTILEVTPACYDLAQAYIDAGILAARRMEDALHVAVATLEEMDVLVSWNHRHIANVRKTEQYMGVNLIHGYWKTPLILTPLEVLYE